CSTPFRSGWSGCSAASQSGRRWTSAPSWDRWYRSARSRSWSASATPPGTPGGGGGWGGAPGGPRPPPAPGPGLVRCAPLAQRHPYQREEIFGPECALYTISDVDQAIAAANDSDYGL